MTTQTKTQTFTSDNSSVVYEVNQTFDKQKMRHYFNGECSVLHCHHYATLFTQLATDAQDFQGPTHLAEASAETFYPILKKRFKEQQVSDVSDRISLVEQYYSLVGLGRVKFQCSDGYAAVEMGHSHVDEGWLKKWGPRDSRVNFMGEGYIKAACAAIFDLNNWNNISVQETQSIVCGASTSRFEAKWQR